MWHQGYETAPEIVKLCLRSWRRFNPEWKIIALDRHSLEKYLDASTLDYFKRKDLTIQAVSNIIRLCLLTKYGGVWVDATVFCCKPLNAWLPAYFSSGFFAFQYPARDRLISSWLIAADANNILLRKLHEEYLSFWSNNYFSNQNNKFGKLAIKILSGRFRKHTGDSLFWFSFVPRKILRVYPYFVFHFIFNRIVLENEDCREAWQCVKEFKADFPHRLQFFKKRKSVRQAIAFIDGSLPPVFKLNWREDIADSYWRPVLARLNNLLSRQKFDEVNSPMAENKPTDYTPMT